MKEEQLTCPHCWKAVDQKLLGLCPECMLKAGMATATGQHGRFEPPTVEALAKSFPQLEILELIGRGGMGAVYRARQKQLDRVVALKILPPDVAKDPAFADRFAREARALAALSHANIVTLYEFGEADGLYFFLMEYVDGVNLRQLMSAGKLAPKEALAIVPQVCDALQYAHDRGIVHRDIKPENILIGLDGVVKIADFGVAKIIGERHEGTEPRRHEGKETLGQGVVGTPAYMAPEQVEHPAEVDHRADIYSLGVVLYQMLTGELPAERIEPPSRKVQIDVRIDQIVLRALEREPERRYETAGAMKTLVETVARANERKQDARSGQAEWHGRPWYRWIVILAVRDGHRVVRWSGVLQAVVVMVTMLLLWAALGYMVAGNDQSSGLFWRIWTLMALLGAVAGVYRLLSLPLDQLPRLEDAAWHGEKTVTLHWCLILGLTVGMVFLVPMVEPVYKDLRLILPVPTRWTLVLSRFLANSGGWMLMPLMVAAEAAIVVALARHGRQRLLRAWHIGGTTLAVLFAAAVLVALWLPLGRTDVSTPAQTGMVSQTGTSEGRASRSPGTTSVEVATTLSQSSRDRLPARVIGSGWREAFAQGQKIAALPAEQGLAILQRDWASMPDVEARQQMLKAFALAGHDRLADVLDLGMRDPSPAVQSWAIQYLRPLALRDFAEDFAAYENWYTQAKGKTTGEVFRASLDQWMDQAPDAKVLERGLKYLPDAFRGAGNLLHHVSDAQMADLRALLGDVIREGRAGQRIAALAVAQCLPVDEQWQRSVILPVLAAGKPNEQTAAVQALGRSGNTWAVAEIVRILMASVQAHDRALIWTAATALGEIADPKVIPDLIELIAADNTYDTVYGIGYFALWRLTGVQYHDSHNGAWWREWWKKNASRFSAAAVPPTADAETRGEGR